VLASYSIIIGIKGKRDNRLLFPFTTYGWTTGPLFYMRPPLSMVFKESFVN